MPFLVSPGVNVSEIDLTTIVPVLGVSEGGWAGKFQWGPVDEVRIINDEIELVRTYWEPDNNTFTSFYTAANFLSYTNNLRVVRASNTSARNAVSDPNDGIIESIAITETSARIRNGTYPLIITGGSGANATANVTVANGVVSSVTIITNGDGYVTAPNISFGNTQATFTATINANTGIVTTISIGSNSAILQNGTYALTITNGLSGANTDDEASATATVESGEVTSVEVVDEGFGYISEPTIRLYNSNTSMGYAVADFESSLITNANPYIPNELIYTEQFYSGSNNYGQWAAKYPGSVGNSLKISIFSGSNTAAFEGWDYFGYFDGITGTSQYVADLGGANDEIHMIVVDSDGEWTGTRGSVLERFANMSKASDAVTYDGSSNYYKTVINQRSNYIWWLSHPEDNVLANNNVGHTNWGSPAANANFAFLDPNSKDYQMVGGVYSAPRLADTIRAYDKLKNPDEVDLALLMAGDHGATITTYLINNIAEIRKDCVVFTSPRRTDVIDNLGQEAEDCVIYRRQLPSSSYGVMDSNWKYQFDKYNDVYRWVPLSGDIAGLCARTDNERDPWFSPAGFNRGQIKNVVRFAWNPDQSDRDTLYKNGINPVLRFPGEGPILYGDKTLQAKPSAFDRINVRRLFIVLEKAIARAAKYSLFEFNDEFTRSQFIALVEPFLRDVQGRRGIYDFRVVCDTTNNTPEVIDRNEFIGDIYIKPARSINFIQLNFVAVRTGVAFEEVVGRF